MIQTITTSVFHYLEHFMISLYMDGKLVSQIIFYSEGIFFSIICLFMQSQINKICIAPLLHPRHHVKIQKEYLQQVKNFAPLEI